VSEIENAVELKVLSANMHVGEAMGPGFAAQVHLLHPDIIFMSEVVFNAPTEMEKLLGGKYLIAPDLNHRIGRESSQTPVLLLKSRFELIGQSNAQVSEWLGGGAHGRLWPTRFATQVRAQDNLTHRIVNARAVHTWALGPNVPGPVLREHEHQVDSVVTWAASKAETHVVLAAGDWNEDLNNPQPSYAVRNMATAGMKRAGEGREAPDAHTSLHGPTYLDDVFYKGAGVRVVDHKIVRNAGKGADHKMIVATFNIQPKH
jgi:hypothetical protein